MVEPKYDENDEDGAFSEMMGRWLIDIKILITVVFVKS